MKAHLRPLLGIIALACVAIPAAAQDDDAQTGLDVLLKFSVDRGKYSETGPSAIPASGALGFNYGLDFQILTGTPFTFRALVPEPAHDAYEPDPSVAKKWAPGICGGLQYISKGAKFDGETSHSDYLELTVQGEATAIVGEGRAFFRLGPYFGYGVGGKTGSGANEVSTFGGQNGFRRFDAGASIALGYKFYFGGVIYLCYELGLVNRAPATNGGFPTDYKDHTRAIGINIAYPIGKIVGASKSK